MGERTFKKNVMCRFLLLYRIFREFKKIDQKRRIFPVPRLGGEKIYSFYDTKSRRQKGAMDAAQTLNILLADSQHKEKRREYEEDRNHGSHY
jgi:hypothetical protein